IGHRAHRRGPTRGVLPDCRQRTTALTTETHSRASLLSYTTDYRSGSLLTTNCHTAGYCLPIAIGMPTCHEAIADVLHGCPLPTGTSASLTFGAIFVPKISIDFINAACDGPPTSMCAENLVRPNISCMCRILSTASFTSPIIYAPLGPRPY